MAAPKLEERYTYEDYLTWPDDERWELINGVPYDMCAAPSRRHQELSGEIFGSLHSFLKGKPCRVYAAPFDVRLLNDKGICDTVVQPDISVICDKAKLDDRGCLGAPDVIIEILSPSTAAKDLKEKLSLYERHGVKEYWVVLPRYGIVFRFNLDDRGEYGKPKIFSPPDKMDSGVLAGLEIPLDEVFEEI